MMDTSVISTLPRPQKYTASVVSKDKVSAKVYLARFSLVDPPTITFLAGQNIMIQVGDGVNRSMSIASLPREQESVLIAHDISPMGPGSRHMIDLEVGDTVRFIGPLGMFVLDTRQRRHKVFLATGTGIAPFRSMIWDYLEKGGTDEIHLYWGVRYAEDIFWREELEDLARRFKNFYYLLTLSQPSDTWRGKSGRVTDHISMSANLPASTDYYLCGNKQMVYDVGAFLFDRHVPKEHIKTELFY
ncbi:MAG: FAD-binding oxidoreductase [bacterium]|nr:FAD-binding oxidoreductase [bacterium]